MKLSKIRTSIDVENLLVALGVKFVRKDQEIVARCISGEHDDKNPSWSIHDEPGDDKHGVFHCFSCGWSGNVFTLIEKARGVEFEKAVEFAMKFVNGHVKVRQPDEDRTFNTRELTAECRVPSGIVRIARGSQCWRYLESRGIGAKEIETYNLRDWIWRRRVWVPITSGGRLVTWLARTYDGDRKKVLHPKGDRRGTRWGIFGIDQVDRSLRFVSLSEGWVSAIRVRQAEIPNSTAINGATLTEEQAEQLAFADTVVAWREGDAGGAAFERSIKGWFRRKKVVVIRMQPGYDPGDHEAMEIRKIYEERMGSCRK